MKEDGAGGILFVIFLIVLFAATGNKEDNGKYCEPAGVQQEQQAQCEYRIQRQEKKDAKFRDKMDYEFGNGKYADQRWHAQEKGKSGSPRWMEPFSKVDMFGKPTVFSPDFMKR